MLFPSFGSIDRARAENKKNKNKTTRELQCAAEKKCIQKSKQERI